MSPTLSRSESTLHAHFEALLLSPLSAGLLALLVLAWVLGFAVAGRFNDGGWYLNAARLVLEGAVPYRDFYFPHPPLALLVHVPAAALGTGAGMVLLGRIFSAAMSLLGIALGVMALETSDARRRGVFLGLLLLALSPYSLYFLSMVKAYPSSCLSLGACLLALARGRPGLAGVALGLGLGARLSLLAALPGLALALRNRRPELLRALGGTALGAVLVYLPAIGLAGAAMRDQFYIPVVALPPVNSMTGLYVEAEVGGGALSWMARVLGSLIRLSWTHAPLFLVLLVGRRTLLDDEPPVRFAALGVLFMGGAHLLARRPYDDYQLILLPLALYLAARVLTRAGDEGAGSPARWTLTALALVLLSFPALLRGVGRLELSPNLSLVELRRAGRLLREAGAPGKILLTLDPYLLVAGNAHAVRGMELGRFGLRHSTSEALAGAGGRAVDVLEGGILEGRWPALALPLRDPAGLDPAERLSAAAGRAYRQVGVLKGFGERRLDLAIWERRADWATPRR